TRAQVEAGKSDTWRAQPKPTAWPLGWSTPSRRQIRTEVVSLPLFPSLQTKSPLGRIVRAESGEMCELLHTSNQHCCDENNKGPLCSHRGPQTKTPPVARVPYRGSTSDSDRQP